MDYNAMLRSLDTPHDAYVNRVFEAFEQYEQWTRNNADDVRQALAALATATDATLATLAAKHSLGDDDAAAVLDKLGVGTSEEYATAKADIDRSTTEARATIKGAQAASNARAYEWLTTQVALARLNFNVALIDAVAEHIV